MSLHGLRKGQRVKMGASEFQIMQRIPEKRWQLQNAKTGEWCTSNEDDLLDQIARNELSFVVRVDYGPHIDRLAEKLARDLFLYPPELVALAQHRVALASSLGLHLHQVGRRTYTCVLRNAVLTPQPFGEPSQNVA